MLTSSPRDLWPLSTVSLTSLSNWLHNVTRLLLLPLTAIRFFERINHLWSTAPLSVTMMIMFCNNARCKKSCWVIKRRKWDWTAQYLQNSADTVSKANVSHAYQSRDHAVHEMTNGIYRLLTPVNKLEIPSFTFILQEYIWFHGVYITSCSCSDWFPAAACC